MLDIDRASAILAGYERVVCRAERAAACLEASMRAAQTACTALRMALDAEVSE